MRGRKECEVEEKNQQRKKTFGRKWDEKKNKKITFSE